MEAFIWETADELDQNWHHGCVTSGNAALFHSRDWRT